MKTTLNNLQSLLRPWAQAGLLCAIVALGSIGAGAGTVEAQNRPQAKIDAARSDFTHVSGQIDGLREQQRGLERRYEGLIDQIEARKRARSGAELIGDLELGNKLGQARALAEQLYALQEQLRAMESAREELRREVLGGYDAQIVGLEESILRGDGQRRAAAIDALNALRKARHAWVGKAQATPDLKLSSLPRLDDVALDDPEEAMAAAGELDDTRRKLDEHIVALNDQIESLERDRRLRRKAQDFRDQESFFDDASSGGRRVVRSEGGSRTQIDTDRGRDRGNNDAANAPGEADNRGDEQPEAAPLADPEVAEGDDFDGATTDNGAPNRDGEGLSAGAGDPSPLVGPSRELPGVGLPSDPFASGAVIVKGDVEGFGGVEGGAYSKEGESLEARLSRLKKEKEALERKSRDLESRSNALKKRAYDY